VNTTTDFSQMNCSIARSFGVMGDAWKALIIRDVSLGLTRFDHIAQDLGVSRKVLTQRLNDMVADGLLERVAYQQQPVRYDYVLTDMGADLVPIMLAVLAWGDRWLLDGTAVPAIPLHRGHECRANVVCASCRKPIAASDVGGAVGPSGTVGPGTQLIGSRMRPRKGSTQEGKVEAVG
jgi:DNA-binding HxlR family transcriptional regulator